MTDLPILALAHDDLRGETERAVQNLLAAAFGTDGDYYAVDRPDRIFLVIERGQPVGHLAAYARTVGLDDESLDIGLIGGVAVDPRYQRRGCARRLLEEAHRHFAERALPFSVLFAFDPARYVSSGYRLMTNPTRFLDSDGRWKQLVYRGGMVAELGTRPWPAAVLDLRGRAI